MSPKPSFIKLILSHEPLAVVRCGTNQNSGWRLSGIRALAYRIHGLDHPDVDFSSHRHFNQTSSMHSDAGYPLYCSKQDSCQARIEASKTVQLITDTVPAELLSDVFYDLHAKSLYLRSISALQSSWQIQRCITHSSLNRQLPTRILNWENHHYSYPSCSYQCPFSDMR